MIACEISIREVCLKHRAIIGKFISYAGPPKSRQSSYWLPRSTANFFNGAV